MSLVGMIQSSLGGAIAPVTHRESFLGRKAGIAIGAGAFGYANGRWSAPGKDHAVVKLPDFLGGREAPADLTYAIVASIAAFFDVVPFGLDDWAGSTADGALGIYIGRTATMMGSEAKIKALASATASGTQQAAAGVIDMRPHAARKYKMAG